MTDSLGPVDWDAVVTPAYLTFSNGLRGTAARADALTAVGVDPSSTDDRLFGTDFVYCGSHLAAHHVGWCTVALCQKVPLVGAASRDAAEALCRERGLRLIGDPPGAVIVDWDTVLTPDFLTFTNGSRGVAVRARELEALGFDPSSTDDRVFGTEYVYCGEHLAAHHVGWCEVRVVQKVPLVGAASRDEADALCRRRGLPLNAPHYAVTVDVADW